MTSQDRALIASTGAMLTSRSGHVAVRLQDGRVLVAGGGVRSSNTTTLSRNTELYTPVTGTWSATGELGVARSELQAIRLKDGRVLVAGGRGADSQFLSSAELYDPATGTWSATGSFTFARASHTLSLLQDGRVLLAGGNGWADLPLAAELYDPATGTWSTTGALSIGRYQHTATVLPDGKVLAVGGVPKWYQGSSGTTPSAELYDPATGTWSTTGSLVYSRTSHSAHLLPNGRVLVVGGYALSIDPTMSELYDPSSGTWAHAGQLLVGRYITHGVSLADGGVLVTGLTRSSEYPRFERYNLTTGAWALTDHFIEPRAFHTATLLDNGQVLLAGGDRSYSLTSAELYTDVASSDLTPPVTQLTSPASGTTLSKGVTLGANASDNEGVTQVQFYMDGAFLGNDTTAPYSLYWNTTYLPDGHHVLTSRAYDAAGNVSSSAQVPVLLDNDPVAPTTRLTSPADGATLSGWVTLSADASDNKGVVRVDFYRGGTLMGSDTTAPYSISWNSATASNRNWILTTRAHDALGNMGTSPGVTVTVNNPIITAPPVMAEYDAVLKVPRCSSVGSSCDTGTLVNGRAGLGAEPNHPNTLQGACADGPRGSGYHLAESLDGLKLSTLDATAFAPGKTVKIEAKVWVMWPTQDFLDLYYLPNVNNPSWVYLTTLKPGATGAQTLSTQYTLPSGNLQALRASFRYGGNPAYCTIGAYDDRDDLVFAVGN